MKLCDIHCHVLPGVDDGAKTMKETLDVLTEAVKQGSGSMIVTPHYHPGKYRVNSSQVLEKLDEVRLACRQEGLDITLYSGQECYYYSGLVEQLDRGKVLTLAGSRYVLVEFEPECPFTRLQKGLRDLHSSGYEPILAHFERYDCLRDESNLRWVKECGFRLQMNYDTLLQKEVFFRKQPWKGMVRQGIVDFLGSDCHGTHFRPLHAREMQKCVDSLLTPSQKEKLLETNVNRILKKE
ncbi:MAG: protein tyrosine phosphatase [Eubacteriales bacterium]|nr:protein tyrosine phosphatase [Eubacteriales bacterium]